MLRAPVYQHARTIPEPGTLPVRPAVLPDVWRIASGHSRAVTARLSPALRPFTAAAPVAVSLRLVCPIGRSEVWTGGVGTSVVMTPDRTSRTPVRTCLLAAAAHLLVLVVTPAAVAATTVAVGGPVAVVGPLVAVGWLVVLLLPLLAAALRVQSRAPVPLSRMGTSGRVVRLHDLARHPADPAGTGTALLAAVLAKPTYRHDTVVTTAASPRLADLYVEAGMTRNSAGSTGGGVA